ncbi:MAG: efflux RND transporter permease subunit [Planctomycetes bacterium]|nr:efflux RND transporter permease subunit [Planctomycetota bacterium]
MWRWSRLGRNLNVISLAGLAFAVGMVVDNAIVVLENIFRHMEMGQTPASAAYRGAREVWGAIVASTLTTVAVFLPILYVEEEAGQLFRDIALAICAAVLLSLVTSITVIPCAANRWFRNMVIKDKRAAGKEAPALAGQNQLRDPSDWGRSPSALVARMVHFLTGSLLARLVLVAVFAFGSIYGSKKLMPPTDYLPAGNRNIVFGMIFTPPGYSIDTMASLGERVEKDVRPFWEAGELKDGDPAAYEQACEDLPEVPAFNWFTNEIDMVRPPSIDNYFFVGFNGMMFHGAISSDPKRVVDVSTLLTYASRAENMPGTFAFSRQLPLFNLSGASGSSINIELVGDDMEELTTAATNAYMALAQEYGYTTVQPSPANFNVPGPELRVVLDRVRASNLGLTTRDVGLAVRALGDGAMVGEYRIGGDAIDLTMIDRNAIDENGRPVSRPLHTLGDIPIATPGGQVVPLTSVAILNQTSAPQEIDRVEERRAITLQFTPEQGKPLEQAMKEIVERIDGMRRDGVIPPAVETSLAGTADKLSAVRRALLGDGTVLGLLGSRMFLALLIVYLLMCVLFESFLYPLAILLSVPLATLGGFAALRAVFLWSVLDPYMPMQNLDVLTMLGFVILIGVVVNNAILIVHQALNFMRGESETSSGSIQALPPRLAIAESVRTRLRPILMSTFTSVGGMLPLVLMPGSGSELYRGLGSVVVGGLLVSTIFTLVLVPLLFSLVLDLKKVISGVPAVQPNANPASSPQAV